MKLIIHIPCFNEAQTLGQVLADLPREVRGVDQIEYLVIDDGSRDTTSEVAVSCSVDHLVRHPRNLGLARSFQAGLREALRHEADIIVNTDGDHQYRGEDIEALVQPIISGDADMVVGARPIAVIKHFSPIKKLLQFVGSLVVRQVSGLKVPDAPSGFRAMSRDTALRLIAFGTFTYTIETLIQAGSIGLRVQSVDIGVNPPTRGSRLFKSQSRYVLRAAETILLTYLVYRPTKLFFLFGAFFGLSGMGLSLRYLYFNAIGEGTGHVQSVIIAGTLSVASTFMFSLAAIAYLLGINRRLLEEIRFRDRDHDFRRKTNVSCSAAIRFSSTGSGVSEPQRVS